MTPRPCIFLCCLAAWYRGAIARLCREPCRPASLNEQAPVYKVKSTQPKALRGRGLSRLRRRTAPDRFYNLRQTLLRQRTLLPRHRRLHGAVAHQRRSQDLGGLGATPISLMIRQAEQRARNLSFADRGSNTRTTQVFINFATMPGSMARASRLRQVVLSGMECVDSLYNGYGEARRAARPEPGHIQMQGKHVSEKTSQARLHQEGDHRAITHERERKSCT